MKVATHKYGVEIPSSIEHYICIDDINGNQLWQGSLDKDMHNVSVVFEILPTGVSVPVGWKNSYRHLIRDVNMDFTQKARWIKDGHLTPDPKDPKYGGVVSRDSVIIAVTYDDFNNVDVTAADIQNFYLQAPSYEKHYVICGKYFGIEHEGKIALIWHALYGGKLADRHFWTLLRSCM